MAEKDVVVEAVDQAMQTLAAVRSHLQASTPDRWLTLSEAATCLGVSVKWIYRHRKGLPFVFPKPLGSGLRASERRLSEWMEQEMKR